MLPPAPLAVFSSPDEASESVFPTPRPTLPTTPPTVLTVPGKGLISLLSLHGSMELLTACYTSDARSQTAGSIAEPAKETAALLGLLGRVVVVAARHRLRGLV